MSVTSAPTMPAQQAQMPSADQEREGRMQLAVQALLHGLGEDTAREGLRDTPKRVVRALLHATLGYRHDPVSVLGSALFHEPLVAAGGGGVVLVRDIDFASTCEATLLPYHGRCHIAYVPRSGVVLGLSKLARLTQQLAKRFTCQAGLGEEIACALHAHLDCGGVAVILHAQHLTLDIATDNEQLTACVTGSFRQLLRHPEDPLQEILAVLGLDSQMVDHHISEVDPTAQLSPSNHHQQQQQQLHMPGQRYAPSACLSSSSSYLSADLGLQHHCQESASQPSSQLSSPLQAQHAVHAAQAEGRAAALQALQDLQELLPGAHSRACQLQAMQQEQEEASAATVAVAFLPSACSGSASAPMQAEEFGVVAPVTPDVSEKDTDGESTDDMALDLIGGCGSSSSGVSTGSMEAAVQLMLLLLGENPSRQGLQGSASQYVAALLSSTSGYQQPLPASCRLPQDMLDEGTLVGDQLGAVPAHESSPPQWHSVGCSCCNSNDSSSQQCLGGAFSEQHSGVRVQEEACSPSSRPAVAVVSTARPCDVKVQTLIFGSQCEHHMLPFYGSISVAFMEQVESDAVHAPDPAGISSGGGRVEPEQQERRNGQAACSSRIEAHLDAEPVQHTVCTTAVRGATSSHRVDALGSRHCGDSTWGAPDAARSADIEQIVAVYTKRLQVQERITHQVADAVAALPGVSGVMVVVDAAHMCMVARGVENHAGRTTSFAARGDFDGAPALRRFLLAECRVRHAVRGPGQRC